MEQIDASGLVSIRPTHTHIVVVGLVPLQAQLPVLATDQLFVDATPLGGQARRLRDDRQGVGILWVGHRGDGQWLCHLDKYREREKLIN